MNYVKKKKFDKLGRIVIPKDMRDFYNFDTAQAIEIIPTEEGVLLVASKVSNAKENKKGLYEKKSRCIRNDTESAILLIR